MKLLPLCFVLMLLLVSVRILAQDFSRSRILAGLENPWEIVYGPDDHLWISEQEGKVVRVSPETGESEVVYAASDYFPGADSEDAPCGLGIGANTYGLALHPDFPDPAAPYIYYIYSYNSGTAAAPATLFKIVRLTWDATSAAVTAHEDLVPGLANGFDHFGGRLIAVRQEGKSYLYYSTGDTGANREDCYPTPADNPNLGAQDPYTKVGKIHRLNIDGTVPEDNPIPGNSFFTRGHRNPQGLAYNPVADVVYAIEHGHTTDDEINVLDAGMNYGWKDVQGYHDGNYPGELAYVANYQAHPDVPNDSLREPLYAWGTVPPAGGGFLTWPTVAPSDGTYYGSDGIPDWTNSLLVVTLKNGTDTFQEVFRFKLNPDGRTLAPSSPENPNPETLFREDYFLNGRLRDVAVSPDGKRLFLITNNRNGTDPIIVYSYLDPTDVTEAASGALGKFHNAPNPFSGQTTISTDLPRAGHLRIDVTDALGRPTTTLQDGRVPAGPYSVTWDGRNAAGQAVAAGTYFYTISFDRSQRSRRMLLLK